MELIFGDQLPHLLLDESSSEQGALPVCGMGAFCVSILAQHVSVTAPISFSHNIINMGTQDTLLFSTKLIRAL